MLKILLRPTMILGLLLLSGIVSLAQSTVSITSNFNGTTINPGNYVYFNSVLNPSGLSTTAPTTITLTGASLNIAGTVYQLPNATITYVPGGTTASTVYNAGTNTWVTTVPLNSSGNEFLTALPIQFPIGLPGGASPVVFTGTFSSNTPGVGGNFQFGAAVYTQMPSDLNLLGVKAADGVGGSDHAGTPENYKQYVTGGARGGGGSNYTGSYSATGHFTSGCCATPTPTPTITPTPTPPYTQTPTPPTTVPEPASIILMATGLLGIGGALRKRFGKRGTEEEV